MASGLEKLKEQIKELGFGSKAFSGRLINKQGGFNVNHKGAGLKSFSPYHWLINMHWFYFIFVIIGSYVMINLIFAVLYLWAGTEQLSNYQEGSGLDDFLHCFYFSTQTLTTVGFGTISPIGHLTNIIASFEAMIGLLSFALATGILYGRFSKAKAKILFSDNALISPYQDIKGFMFRITNMRKNHLIEMSARLVYSYLIQEDGVTKRKYRQLELEIDFINMFPLPWTIVHPLDGESPIKGKKSLDFAREEAEFLVILKGYDDTFNQYVHQVYSYRHDEIVFDAKFEPMFYEVPGKKTIVHIDRINDFRKVFD
ncbi:MAG: ion channel [Bacteroidota bacterium]